MDGFTAKQDTTARRQAIEKTISFFTKFVIAFMSDSFPALQLQKIYRVHRGDVITFCGRIQFRVCPWLKLIKTAIIKAISDILYPLLIAFYIGI